MNTTDTVACFNGTVNGRAGLVVSTTCEAVESPQHERKVIEI